MPRPFFVSAFLDELPLKVVSLVIAISLFAVVRSDKDAASGAYVKVIYALPRDRVLVSDPAPEVRVGVRGPWTRLSRFDERSIDPIRIDLSDHTDGTLRFDEAMVKLPAGLRVASISPSEVKLEFAPKVERDLPVQPVLEGQPAEGFRVAKVTAEPETVHVEGARRAVESMKKVPTRPLRIDGARGPVHGEVAFEPPPHLVQIDAQTVEVNVEVAAAIGERSLDALPIRVFGLDKLEGQVDPPQARLILRGPAKLLEAVTPDTLSLSVEGQLVDTRPPAKYLRTVTVNGLPSGVAAEVQPDTVMLSTHRKRE